METHLFNYDEFQVGKEEQNNEFEFWGNFC